MKRMAGWIAALLIVVGVSISGWNLYKWYSSTKSVHNVEAHDNSKVETGMQKKKEPKNEPKKESKHKDQHKKRADFSTLKTDQQKGNEVAKLIIPKLDLSYDVFWGTDENTLKEGVGMYVSKWTTVPNPIGGHTVLSGHRDTVFTKLGDLDEGDTLTEKYHGKSYQYRIKKIWITNPDDRSVIVKKDKPTLTLTTCYPFHYIGPAPKRYIVQAELVK